MMVAITRTELDAAALRAAAARSKDAAAARTIVRWRCVDLRDEIARSFGVQVHERTVGKLLVRLNFAHVSVRPRHPEQDVGAQEAHKKTIPNWSPLSFPRMVAASRLCCGGRTKRGSVSRAA